MNRALTLILLLFTIAFGTYSQDQVIDTAEMTLRVKSIREILQREKSKLHDSIIADYYLQLAEYSAQNFDYAAAILQCDTILNQYSKLSFLKRKEVEEQRAVYLQNSGKSDEAIRLLLGILSDYERRKHFDKSADLNKRIGIIFLHMGDLANAEYHLLESIKQAKISGQFETEGYANMSLGNRYKAEDRFEEAERCYKKSIAIAKKHNIQRLLAGNYNNYGSLMRKMNQMDRSMEYYKMAMEINIETGNDQWLSYNYNNIGNLYDTKKNYSEALKYFFLSMDIKDKIGDVRGKVQTALNIASVYEALGNFEDAVKYHKLYTALTDTVRMIDNANESKRLAAEFQSEKRVAEIKQLSLSDQLNKQALAAQEERISYQKRRAWMLRIGIVMILIIALILWRTTISRKKINEELQLKNDKIDSQHNEIISSINYAKRIQNSILPGTDRMRELLKQHAVLFRPKEIISGDFYICDQIGTNIFFGTVDCTGHGVPGAMMSIVASSHINRALREFALTDPGDILCRLNSQIPEALSTSDGTVNDGMDMSLCVLDAGKMQLKFAGAQHNCWILNSKESAENRNLTGLNYELYEDGDYQLLELKGDRFGIGKSSSSVEFKSQQLELVIGDTIVLTSDGFQDQFGGPRNKKFKLIELRKLILSTAGSSPEQIVNTLDSALQDWMGDHEQVDDICVFVVRV